MKESVPFLRNEAGTKVQFFKRNEAGTERRKLRNEKRNEIVPFFVPFKRKIQRNLIKLQVLVENWLNKALKAVLKQNSLNLPLNFGYKCENQFVFEGRCRMIFKRNEERNEKRNGKRNGKGTRQERKRHLLKRNEAGTKMAFLEKERGRNAFLKNEERFIPWGEIA